MKEGCEGRRIAGELNKNARRCGGFLAGMLLPRLGVERVATGKGRSETHQNPR